MYIGFWKNDQIIEMLNNNAFAYNLVNHHLDNEFFSYIFTHKHIY